jgi:uncharacterized cupredoxin-like copper-binding protein
MIKTLILLSLICFSCGNITIVSGQSLVMQRRKPTDKVKATRTVKGYFTGFEVGDYLHALIKTSAGSEISFFVTQRGMKYFLALHKGQPMEFTYQVVDTYLPEPDDIETIKRLVATKVGDETYSNWWRQIKARLTMRQIQETYDPMVQAAIIEE